MGEYIEQLEDLVHRVVKVGGSPRPWTLQEKLNLLERVIELLRLKTGDVQNDVLMVHMLDRLESVDIGANEIHFRPDRGPKVERRQEALWHHPRQLQVPLLLHLSRNWKRKHRIHALIRDLVKEMRPFLTFSDVERTKTGVTRVATNSRFAARAFRHWRLLQVSPDVAYKAWELTHVGVLIGARLADEVRRGWDPTPRQPGVRAGQLGLHPKINRIISSWQDVRVLQPDLVRIAAPNQSLFPPLAEVVRLAGEYRDATENLEGASSSERRRRSDLAAKLLGAVEKEIAVVELADTFAVDLAIRDLTEGTA